MSGTRQAAPLRVVGEGEEGLEAPEALLAAALIASGDFNPEHYHVSLDDLGCWEKVYIFCLDYQRSAGCAPPMELVHANFPDFRPMETVDRVWAATQIRAEASARSLRLRMAQAQKAMNDGDVEEAYNAFANLGQPKIDPTSATIDLFDEAIVASRENVVHIPTPYSKLNLATEGGIGSGELWYYMARPEQGKSMMVAWQAALSLRQGYAVGYISLEMPARQIARRILRMLAGRDKALQNKVESFDHNLVREAQAIIRDMVGGTLWMMDTNSNNGLVSVSQVAEHLDDVDLMCVDHTGLLTNPEGRSHTDENKIIGSVSNMLRQQAIMHDKPILAINHVNRTGDNPSSTRPPALKHAAESDHIGRDGDVVVSMKRLSESVMVAETVKLREHAHVVWHHRYDPARNDYNELAPDVATDIVAAETSRLEKQYGD